MPDQPYGGDPAASPLATVRFILGDTTQPFALDDSEVTWLIDAQANTYFAAAMGADILAARYSGKANRTVGDLSISWADTSRQYRDLAKSLRAMANDPRLNGVPVPYMGGEFISDKRTDRSDTDLVQPYFRTGGMGGPGSDPRELSTDVGVDHQSS